MTFARPSATAAIICGGLLLTFALGVRQSFGLYLAPMTVDLGIGREAFAFAMAINNIAWGVAQPFAGILADKYGAGRMLVICSLGYIAGLLVMAGAEGPLGINIGGGLMIGLALSGTTFAVVLSAIGRLVPEEKRSMALGVASAGGSVGQFAFAPISQGLISNLGWSGALVALAIICVAMVPLAIPLRGKAPAVAVGGFDQTLSAAMREAMGHSGYRYLTLGFFVCGFQVVFVAVHLPAYISDVGLSSSLAATALAMIGFFNVIGTYLCGLLGGKYPKKYLLSGLYLARSFVIAAFLVAPKTEMTIIVFSAVIGLLWLGTVPLTSGLVAHLFGPRYMATLFGFVFFSHQVGSFLGAWLGGVVFDRFGSYDSIWIASIALGVVSAALHLPITEEPVERPLATAES